MYSIGFEIIIYDQNYTYIVLQNNKKNNGVNHFVSNNSYAILDINLCGNGTGSTNSKQCIVVHSGPGSRHNYGLVDENLFRKFFVLC